MMASTMADDDIKGFETALHVLITTKPDANDIIGSWAHGNVAALAKSNAEEAVKSPKFKQVILDQRNRNWMPQIDKMLTEKTTIFITVGAAHLAGKGSVVDMLCAEGWNVQRLKTGASPPPPACPAEKAKPSKPANEVALH